MDSFQIYTAKENNSYELVKMFLSLYHYLLFNNNITLQNIQDAGDNTYTTSLGTIIGRFLQKIDFIKTDQLKYTDFFYRHFVKEQNIYFFTLFNQIPIDFLPFPETRQYFKFPIITFADSSYTNTIESMNEFIDEKFIHTHQVKDIDKIWEDYKHDPNLVNLSLHDKYPDKFQQMDMKQEDGTKYRNFKNSFPINKIFSLTDDFFKDKTLCIFSDKPIISRYFKIDRKDRQIVLLKYHEKKDADNYQYNSKKKKLKISSIKYVSVLVKFSRESVINCFFTKQFKKKTRMYHQVKATNFNKFKDNIDQDKYPITFYTLTPFTNVIDPLYINPGDIYMTREYRLIRDIDSLDLTKNIYTDNELIHTNISTDNHECFDSESIRTRSQYCNYDVVDPKLNINNLNYNKKSALLMLIWKNSRYIDKRMGFIYFLKILKIPSFFNIMSLVNVDKGSDEQQGFKLLGEEIYIDKNIVNNHVKSVTDFTRDMNQFTIDEKYKDYKELYF